ncbi:MAG TPA: DUF6259 domain-containing protein [Ignavibacteriales bacterium]|nr:DUF6259 domain-containing protein [Ignavibacteriales bacterium]
MFTVSNKRLQITLEDKPFRIHEILNLETGQRFSTGGKQSVIMRVPSHVSEPAILDSLEEIEPSTSGVSFTLSDETGGYKAHIMISESDEGVKFHMKASGPEPIWMAEWRISGLELNNVIVPALGGQMLTKDMTPDTTLSYKYPFWWNAQFVIGEGKGGGIWLHTKESDPKFRLLRVSRAEKSFGFTLGFEAEAPLKSSTLEAVWFMEGYKGSWKQPVDRHRIWLEKEFNLTKIKDNPHFPKWARDINFILEVWGMRKDTSEPHHTFDEMKERLKDFSRLHPPSETLFYVPGYAEHGIDSHAPDYNPGRHLGGEEKFKELVDFAHQMGYHVMIHTNVLAMTFTHPLYAQFKKYQVVDVFGRPQGWAMDIDGDWLSEEYFAYMNPGYREWGDLMIKVLGELISKYHLDSVFLDQTLLAFNESRGPNFLTGMRSHIERLKEAFPNVLFSGEGIHEQVMEALPMAQIHGIDSLADVHGMEGRKRWKKVHPVSSYLFSKYTRLTAHLLTKYPNHPVFKLQEASYKKLDVIPALCLYNKSQKIDTPEVRQMIRRADELKQKLNNGNKLEANKLEAEKI